MRSQRDFSMTMKKKNPTKGTLNTCVDSLKKFSHNYCENTTIHGLRYITANRTPTESIIWFLISGSAIVLCVILMMRTWNNFSNNPTVTIIDTSNPIWKLHFPGVTICNNNKVYKPHAEIIAGMLAAKGFDDNIIRKLFKSLMKLIRPDTIEIDNVTASWALDILGYTVEQLMFEVMQPCSALLMRCAWLGKIYDCDKIFKVVKSGEGFCCGFNYHYDLPMTYGTPPPPPMNLTSNKEYIEDSNDTDTLPGVDSILHAPGTGRDVGLAVALNIDGYNYKSSVRPNIGATVLVHDPLDFPDVGALASSVQPGHVLALSVGGTSIHSMDDIRSLPLQKRMCLFDGEVPGEHRYSYQTCVSECMVQQIHGVCGCLPFFYPDERKMSLLKVSHINECQCLPQCNDKTYDVVAEASKINDIEFESEITKGLLNRNTSFLYVYFRDATYLEYRKQTIMGWDGLLAAFGGIFGLCVGGSVISLFEFFYHIAMQFFDRNKKKQEQLRERTFPPASEVFVSVPSKAFLNEKESAGNINKQIFLTWDKRLHRRGQNDSPYLKEKIFSYSRD